MCPLIKEFATILGCSLDSTAMIALPDLDIQLPNKLIAFFDMPLDDIYLYLFSSRIMNLSSLITACEIKDKNSATWIRVASFYLYAQFLLVSSHGEVDTRIINILE